MLARPGGWPRQPIGGHPWACRAWTGRKPLELLEGLVADFASAFRTRAGHARQTYEERRLSELPAHYVRGLAGIGANRVGATMTHAVGTVGVRPRPGARVAFTRPM